jgi:hypothetical protein
VTDVRPIAEEAGDAATVDAPGWRIRKLL